VTATTSASDDLTEFLDLPDRFRSGIRGGTVDPVFGRDGTRFTYLDADGVAWSVDPDAGTRTRADPSDPPPVSAVELERRRRAVPRAIRPLYVPIGSLKATEVPSPDGEFLLGELGHDLALRAVIDDRTSRLTTDGEEGRPWQVDGGVWWAAGVAWSPDSLRIAAVRKDVRACVRLPLVSWLQTDEQVDLVPYVKAGGPMPRMSAGVIDVRSREVRGVELPGEDDQLLVPVGWRHDGAEAYFLTTDRRRRYLRLYAADAVTGAARLVCEETQPTFVVGIRDIERFSPAMILGDDERVLWYSERDGWRHLYLYGTDGTEIGRVTSGEFEVLRVLGVDAGTETVFVTAHSDPTRPYDVHVCRVGLDGSGFRQLTTAPGAHDATLAPSGRYLVDTHSAIDRAPSTDLLSVDGATVMTLAAADVTGHADLRLPTVEPFTALAADGVTELHGVLYLPPGFDPARSYPVVEYQYGGPQVAVHPVAFAQIVGQFDLALALASEGYVVYTVDGRGTTERGKTFQDVVHGRFHDYHVEDHAHVLRQLLARHPFMDPARVGITGLSWGGYSTVRSLLLAPELYRVGVAICPVYDIHDQNAFAIEPYMGLPVDRPAAYAAGSSLAIADRLEGRLLMIQGTADVNATFSATMKMCEALARAGKPYDLAVLPGADHEFLAAGEHHVRYVRAATLRYFRDHL
jgi:dipeptidyl aminopeptidase/acylaminoacyl peptidase